ncbi:MAG: TonB-dependent receptor [Candidatus Aminicenantes bacterium]|nr:MAG: TonB-dependent receptor [Candidatus Aminicenantes bacterium]
MDRRKLLSLMILLVMVFSTSLYSQEDIKKIKKYFKMDLHQLLNVVMVTAGKKKEKVGDIPASVVLVSREDIETAGYQTLPEILESIPGLYITDDYTTQNIGVRGFWSFTPNRNMIILVNGIPIFEGLTSSYLLENIIIPVEAIDKIEVIRGPMSVLYGNGAFFGVVNIFTNQPGKEEFANIVTAALGSEKTSKLFLRTSGRSGDFQYTFNGTYFKTDGFDVPLEKTGGPAYTGLTAEDQLERSEKFFNLSGTFKDISFDVSYSENQKEWMFLFPSYSDGNLVIYRDMRLNLGYKRALSDTFSVEAKIGYFQNRMNYDYDWLFEEFYGVQHNETSGFRGELNLFIKPCSKLDITVGMDYLKILNASSNFTIPFFGENLVHYNLADGEAVVNQSIFAQLTYTLSDKLKIVAGAMVEQTPEYTLEERIGDYILSTSTSTFATFSQTKAEFIPRFALIYSLNQQNILKFLYGKAFNRPSFLQNLDLLINSEFPPLEPETIQTFELNYIGFLSSDFTIRLSVFRNILNNLIYRTIISSGGEWFYYHANVGEMTTTGLEFTLQIEPFNNLRLELSGTYQDTKDKRAGFEDINVAYSPKFLGYFNASYFINKNISLAVTGNYVDEMEAYYDDTLPVPGRLGEKVDSYLLMGANLRIRNLFGTGMFINFRCSNLLDQEIHYPATANNSLFASRGTIGRGRSFLLTMGWKF